MRVPPILAACQLITIYLSIGFLLSLRVSQPMRAAKGIRGAVPSTRVQTASYFYSKNMKIDLANRTFSHILL